MKSSRRCRLCSLIAIFVPLLLLGLFLLITNRTESLPSYNGKTVGEWFEGDLGHPGRAETMRKAEVAFKAMGTTCVPYLMEKARGRETVLNRWYCQIHGKLPPSMQKRMGPAIPATYTQMLAVSYFMTFHLGSPRLLEPYMPELIELVPTIKDSNARQTLFSLVEGSVVTSKDTEGKTNFFLSFTNDSNFAIQVSAMFRLSEVDTSITNGQAVLLQALTNRVLVGSAFAPPHFPQGSSEYEAIVDGIQERAYYALSAIDPLLAAQYEKQKE